MKTLYENNTDGRCIKGGVIYDLPDRFCRDVFLVAG